MSLFKDLQKAGIPSLPGYKPPTPPSPASPIKFTLSKHESMTDTGNAQRLIHQHGDKLYYCPAEKSWMFWNGKIWTPDTHNQVETFAKNTARSIIHELQDIHDSNERAALEKWASASMNHARYIKMLKAAMPELSIALDRFDTNKWLLNVDNGTIDLKTGICQPHNRKDLITKICNVRYVHGATSPLWLSFLNRIFNGNRELIHFVQKMVGYFLTGEVSEKCFFILLGESGDNGKTVFVNVIMWLLAEYATQTPIDTLTQRKIGAQSNDIVAIRGARFIAAAEANTQHYFDHALVKRLTGNDPITARRLYQEFITFRPEGKIVIATNRTPRFDKSDTAFSNRIRMIPFDVIIPKDEQDENLEDKLKAEAEGILAWAVEGCLLWQQEGLGAVPVDYEPVVDIRPNSGVEHFLESCCYSLPDHQIMVCDLYAAYLEYLAGMADGTEPLADNVFGSELTKLGIAGDHNRNGNFRIGIALVPEETTTQQESTTETQPPTYSVNSDYFS